jgi:hypothetical protein
MTGWGTVEREPEVAHWFDRLTAEQAGHVAFYIDLLEEHGIGLHMPYARQLDGKLYELRFDMAGKRMRIPYWIASGRRIVLLTVFRKTRMNERDEVDRARRAMRKCQNQRHEVQDHD